MDKKSARRHGLEARASLSFETRKQLNQECFRKLLPYLEEAESIGCYVSMKNEMDTYEIIRWCFEHHRSISVPKTIGNTLQFRTITSFEDLCPGVFGVMEPFRGEIREPAEIDLMIVPLSSFDEYGHRTGYGKGYYDSILGRCRRKIGIAYAVQKMDFIETDPWDQDLDLIISA